jgi:hypothetical protein
MKSPTRNYHSLEVESESNAQIEAWIISLANVEKADWAIENHQEWVKWLVVHPISAAALRYARESVG